MPGVTFTTGGALKKSALRQVNERLVLNAIRQNPLLSRSDLARVTGLSAQFGNVYCEAPGARAAGLRREDRRARTSRAATHCAAMMATC